MILKRLSFPILLFVLLFCSCDKSIDNSKDVNNGDYDKNSAGGFKWMKIQQYDSAFFYFDKAKNTSHNANEKIYSLLQIATIQQLFCDFSGSEATATEAYAVAKESLYLPYIYNTLGIAYEEQYNYDEALKYYNKCYNDSLNELQKCMVRNNIAVVYIEKKEYNKAIKILSKDITNVSLKGDKKTYAKSLDNLGYALFKTSNAKAIDYLNQSLALKITDNDEYAKIASFIHLSQYYQSNNQNQALNFAKEAYQSATKINSPDDRIEALKFWITNAEPILAKKLALQQMSLSDSINKVRQSAKNQFAKIKYDSSKANKEKKYSEQQKKNMTRALVIVTILSLLTIFLVRYRNRQKLKNSVYDTESRIAKKLHDELANDVYNAMTFAENQDLQNPEKKEVLLDNLDAIYTRTRNISKENSEISTGEDFQEILKEMLASYSNNEVNIIINNSNTINWNKLKKETKIAIYRVLQELMVNMKKHSQSSIVIIRFESNKKQLQIKYSDNGIGCPEIANLKKGLKNAENRIHATKGTIIFEPETKNGFRLTISIPK